MRSTVFVYRYAWLYSLILLVLAPACFLSAQTDDILWQTQIATTAVTSVQFSPDGRYVAARAANTVYILSSNSGQLISTLVLPVNTDQERFLNYSFSPDGNSIYVAFLSCPGVEFCEGLTIKKWSITLAEYIHSYTLYGIHSGAEAQDIFTSGWLTYLPNSPYLLVTGAFDYYGRWSTGFSGILYTVDSNSDAITNRSVPGAISSLVLSRDGQLMAYTAKWHTYISSPWEQRSEYGTRRTIIDRRNNLSWQSDEGIRSFTPDNYYALIQRDTALYFWDFRHNITARIFSTHIRNNWYFLTTLNHLLVLRDDGHTAGIYDLATDSWQHFFDGPRAASLSVSPKAHTFASGTYDGKVLLWNISGTFIPMAVQANFSVADTVGRLDQPVTFQNLSFPVQESTKFFWDFGDGNTSTGFNATHRYREAGRYTVRLVATSLNQKSDTLIREQYITVPEISKDIAWRKTLSAKSVRSIVYAQDGTTILSTSEHPTLINALSGQEIKSWSVPCSYVSVLNDASLLMGYTSFPWSNNPEQSCLSWLWTPPSDTLISYCNFANDVLVSDIDITTSRTTNENTSMTSSSDGSLVVFGSNTVILSVERDGIFFNKATGALTIVDKNRDTIIFSSLFFFNHPVTVHYITPDNTHLVTTEFDNQGQNGKIMLRDMTTLKAFDSLAVSEVSPVHFSPSHPDILASTRILWNSYTGSVTALPLQHAIDFAFTLDGRYIIAVFANEDSAAAILDVESRQWKYWYISHPSKQTCLAVAPDGRHFATGALDGSVTVWDIPEEFWPDSTTSLVEQNKHDFSHIQLSLAPNPADIDGCNIRFVQPQASYVSVTICDLFGRTLAVPFDGLLPAGEHNVRWNGKTITGQDIAPGSYFCRMQSEGQMMVQPLLVR